MTGFKESPSLSVIEQDVDHRTLQLTDVAVVGPELILEH